MKNKSNIQQIIWKVKYFDQNGIFSAKMAGGGKFHDNYVNFCQKYAKFSKNIEKLGISEQRGQRKIGKWSCCI